MPASPPFSQAIGIRGPSTLTYHRRDLRHDDPGSSRTTPADTPRHDLREGERPAARGHFESRTTMDVPPFGVASMTRPTYQTLRETVSSPTTPHPGRADTMRTRRRVTVFYRRAGPSGRYWVPCSVLSSRSRSRFGTQTTTADRWGMLAPADGQAPRRRQRADGRPRSSRTVHALVTIAMNSSADAGPRGRSTCRRIPTSPSRRPVGRAPVHAVRRTTATATPVGHLRHLRQVTRRLCGPEVPGDHGRTVATT